MNRFHLPSCRLLPAAGLAAALFLTGCGSSDETAPAVPANPVPLAIEDLNAVGATSSSVTLAWTSPRFPDKSATRYDLRYIAYGSEDAAWDTWTVAAAPEPDAEPGRSRTHMVTGLEAGRVYAFSMRAGTDGIEWSDASGVAVATAAPEWDTTAPAAIKGLLLYRSTPTSLTVAWPPTGDDGVHGRAQGYEVRYAATPVTEATWDAAVPAPGGVAASALPGMLETTLTGLVADREYHVAVKAVDDRGLVSGLSNVIAAMTVDVRTIFVNVEGTGDYRTIEEAIHAAKAGDLVLVGPGHYTWANQATGDSLLGMINVPRDYADFEVRGIAGAEATILDAQHHGKVMSVTGGSSGPAGSLEYAGITIEGFTFTNGQANADGPNPREGWSGGGLNLHLTDTVVRNCIFRDNESSHGGGLWCGGQAMR